MRRLFVGLELPSAARARLGALCTGLANARWVRSENFHLTLRFIGDVDEATADDVHDALREIYADGFPMHLRGLGFFATRRAPRQIWVGVEPNPALMSLQKRISVAISSATTRTGLVPEGRKFVPHVTFARLRDVPACAVADFLAMQEAFCVEAFPVRNFTLYSSKLSPGGPTYRVEAEYPLADFPSSAAAL
ncbi:MAG: RNA 2',3'-cyclic phosphodiesterase [Rhodospirillaceae bacterium]|nr:MAG: RNA 2',3'-cyclic phosphodiesterase [Rhodospirillaceae bacterium]